MGGIQEAIKQIALAYFKPIPQEHGILLETSCLYIKTLLFTTNFTAKVIVSNI